MADRRAGRVPHVRDAGGGKTPRSRNNNGQWRAKRSDTGSTRGEGGISGWAVAGAAVALGVVVKVLRGLRL